VETEGSLPAAGKSRDSLVGIALGYGLGFDSRRGLEIFLFATESRPALGPTQPPIQWVAGALSLGVKLREADHSPPSSAEINNAWIYTSTPKYVFMAWCLVKHRDIFNFYQPLAAVILMIPAHTFPSCFSISRNVILPSTPKSSKF
jgi:hypothetical protein